MTTDLNLIKAEINKQIADQENFQTLITTTFNGLTPQLAKRAMLEGMMRGFTFENFLKKEVYAVPFNTKVNGQYTLSYSLVTSIDYARKIGMRSNVVGKSAPVFEMGENGKPVTCTVTIKKIVGDHIGEYSDTVYFNEYNTGKNLWASKPMTMLAKVAEMHALRMACPEELSQVYVEEEYPTNTITVDNIDKIPQNVIDAVNNAKTETELAEIYKANEGLGKEFSELVTNKKAILTALQNENS